ncbi:MAG: hypothetical protein ACJ8C7_10275, partial [Microvirga sp.]
SRSIAFKAVKAPKRFHRRSMRRNGCSVIGAGSPPVMSFRGSAKLRARNGRRVDYMPPRLARQDLF